MVRSVGYRVRARVQGELSANWWATVFSGLTVAAQTDGTTVVEGELADEAAMYGLLATIRDLGIPLLAIETISEPEEGQTR